MDEVTARRVDTGKPELTYLDVVPSHINLVGAEIEMIEREQREQILKKSDT